MVPIIRIGKSRIMYRAIRRLLVLSKLTPFDTLTVRSMATQAFNQLSQYRHSFRTGLRNTQSVR